MTAFAACAVVMGLAQPALAWGRVGHNYVNGAAVGTLPQDSTLAKFFTANKAYLIAHSSDPDAWRDTDKAEAPHHFIDLDVYGTPSAFALTNVPVSRAEADKRYGHDFVEKAGTVDWTIDQWTGVVA